MGVPKFFRWLSERYPKINQPIHCASDPSTRSRYFNENDAPRPITEYGTSTETTSKTVDPSVPEFDNLYIDMNGIIHGCSHNNSSQQTSVVENPNLGTMNNSNGVGNNESDRNMSPITEEEIFANICHYLDRVVSDIVKPKETIYMAIDGVAPRAKMNQQRTRRFRSGKEAEIALAQQRKMSTDESTKNLDEYGDHAGNAAAYEMDNDQKDDNNDNHEEDLIITESGGFVGKIRTETIKKRNQQEYSSFLDDTTDTTPVVEDRGVDTSEDEVFHHNSITPGTPFLYRCAAHIEHFVRLKLKSKDPAWQDLTIIFSGPNVPGEGEHKIMHYIRCEQEKEKERQRNDLDGVQKISTKRHCLMGQDGDLIMLGLSTHEPNFCLLREKVYFGKTATPSTIATNSGHSVQNSIRAYTENTKFELLHMSVLRDYIAYDFGTKDINPTSTFDLERTIDDFVFLTFFVGNDFLPHMPALDIADGAFDLLFRLYKVHRKKWSRGINTDKKSNRIREMMKRHGIEDMKDYPYFTRSGEIVCGQRLERFLKHLGQHEDPYYNWKRRTEDKEYDRVRDMDKKYGRQTVVPSKEQMKAKEEANRKEYREMLEKIAMDTATSPSNAKPVLTSQSMPFMRVIPKMNERDDLTETEEKGIISQLARLVSDSLSPSSKPKMTAHYELDEFDITDLKGRYYYDKFKFSPLDIESHSSLRKSYVEGLVWCLQYYYQGCVCWDWYYPYHYGPMLSDLENLTTILEQVKFKREQVPFQPFTQLLACMPPSMAYILPKPYQFLMTDHEHSPIIDFYPEDFEVDLNGKKTPWEAVALLPFIDSTRLINAVERHVNMLELTEEEQERNQTKHALVYSVNEDGNLKEEKFDLKRSSDVSFTLPSHVLISSDENELEIDGNGPIEYLRSGFTTLRTVPISGLERKHLGLNVFGSPSRYVTNILNMDAFSYSILPPAYTLGKKFIGTTMYFGYPYFREGFVTAVSDTNGTIRGESQYHRWNRDEALNWDVTSRRLYRRYEKGEGKVGSGGWSLPALDEVDIDIESRQETCIMEENQETQTLVNINMRPLEGLKRLSNGETVKVYEKKEVQVPFLAALWTPHQTDERLHGLRARLEKDPYQYWGHETETDSFSGKYSYNQQRHNPDKGKLKTTMDGDKSTIGLRSAANTKHKASIPALESRRYITLYPSLFSSVPLSAPCHNTFALSSLGSNVGVGILPRTTNINVTTTVRNTAKRSFSSNCRRISCAMEQNGVEEAVFNSSPRSSTRTRLFRYNSCFRMKVFSAAFIFLSSFPAVCGQFSSHMKKTLFFSKSSCAYPKPMKSLHRNDLGHLQPLNIFVRGGSDNSYCSHDPDDHYYPSDETKPPPPLDFAHGTTTISFIFQGGVIAAVDSRASMGNFVGSKTVQKVLPINKYMLGTMAGGAADCSFWIRKLQSYASLHYLSTGQSMTVARASRFLSDFLYQNRHLDLSVGTMIMGFDVRGASIYYVDNSGLRMAGDLFAVGSGSTFALGILDSVPLAKRWSMSEDEAIELGIKAIRHATFRDSYSGGYIGVYLITKNGWKKVFSEDLALVPGTTRRK